MKNLIFDGGNLLHRTFYAAKNNPLINKEGKFVGHILKFLQNIKNTQEIYKADRIFIAWDIRDDDFVNFRQECGEYKEQRDRSERQELHKADGILIKLTECLGICNIVANKLEADDICYYLVSKFTEDENILISADNDFLQLFNYFDNIKIYNPMKSKLITESNLTDFTEGVDKKYYVAYKALKGDVSDNIKGLYKYGPVKSKKFVANFRENFENLNEMDQKTVIQNIKVMDLRQGVKIYPDEAEFYEKQIREYDYRGSDFFLIIDKLGLMDYIGYKMDWRDLFNKKVEDNSQELKDFINSL
jgi:5'-3' exonuclease